MQELEDIKEESLMMANKADAEDCAKRLLCEIARWGRRSYLWFLQFFGCKIATWGAIYCPLNLSFVVAIFEVVEV